MSKNHVFFRDLLIDTSTPLILFVPLKYFYSKYTIPVQSSIFKIQKKKLHFLYKFLLQNNCKLPPGTLFFCGITCKRAWEVLQVLESLWWEKSFYFKETAKWIDAPCVIFLMNPPVAIRYNTNTHARTNTFIFTVIMPYCIY